MSLLANMPAHHVSLRFQCQSYSSTVVTACASGTQAIGEAAEVIRRGAAKLMLAGGGRRRDDPRGGGRGLPWWLCAPTIISEKACKPFDARRDGFVTMPRAPSMIV